MENKKTLGKKKVGFYLTLLLIALSIAAAVAYAVLYSSSAYMSWKVFGAIVVGAAAALLLDLTGHAAWANIPVALGDFIGLLLYVYAIYFYVSSVMVGIQTSTFSWQFQFCTAAFAVLFVLNLINVFVRQVEEGEE